jgi:cyclic pyranopterin phosphate synthase
MAAARSVIDISSKPAVARRAVAEGSIHLRKETIDTIDSGKVKKGDPLAAARVAGLQAIKRTPELLPHCHPIPLEHAEVVAELDVSSSSVRVRVEVAANWKTGVEMEALTGASVALLTVWDMVKYLEKDEAGQYPETKISEIRVVRKEKGR